MKPVTLRICAEPVTIVMYQNFQAYSDFAGPVRAIAEFYLQTVRTVFQEHALPLGKFEWRGRRVDPGAIRRTALFTVEGERDDICAVGQTLAAQELSSSLRPYI